MYIGLKGRTYLGPTMKKELVMRSELHPYTSASQSTHGQLSFGGKGPYGAHEGVRRPGMTSGDMQLPFDPNNPLTPRLLGRDPSPRLIAKRINDADGHVYPASEDGRTQEELADEIWTENGYRTPMYLGASGEIYDHLYEPLPTFMRMRTDLDSNPAKFLEQQQNTRTFEIAPFPMPEIDHTSYFEWEQEVLVWKDRTEKQLRGLHAASMSGRHLYRPRQNRPNHLGERKGSQDVILSTTPDMNITSLPNSETGSTGDTKYHSSSSPVRSLNSAGPLSPNEDESCDAEHPTWDATLILAEPNPVHYNSFEDYSLAMARWAVLVQHQSAKIAPAPRQLPSLLQLANHPVIPPQPASEVSAPYYNSSYGYSRDLQGMGHSLESSDDEYDNDMADEIHFADEHANRRISARLGRVGLGDGLGEQEDDGDAATQRMKLKRRSTLFDAATISSLGLGGPSPSPPASLGYEKRKSLKISKLPLTLISQNSWWESDSLPPSQGGRSSPVEVPPEPGFHVYTPQQRSVRSPGRGTPRGKPRTRFGTPHASPLPGRPGLSMHSHPSSTIEAPARSITVTSAMDPLPPLIPKSARGNLVSSSENAALPTSARGQGQGQGQGQVSSGRKPNSQPSSARSPTPGLSNPVKQQIQQLLSDLVQRQHQRYQRNGRFGAEQIRGMDRRPYAANPSNGSAPIYPEINYKALVSAPVAKKKAMAEAHRTTMWLSHPSRAQDLDVPYMHLSPLGPRHLAANQTSPVTLPMLLPWVEALLAKPRESSRTTSFNSPFLASLAELVGAVPLDPKLHPSGSALHTLSVLDIPSFISLMATEFSSSAGEVPEKSPRKVTLINSFAVWLFPTVRRHKTETLSPRSATSGLKDASDSVSVGKRTIRSNKTLRIRHLQMLLNMAQEIQQPKILFKLSFLLYLAISHRPKQASEIFSIMLESLAQAAPKPENEVSDAPSQQSQTQQSGEERFSDEEQSVNHGGRHRSGSTSSVTTDASAHTSSSSSSDLTGGTALTAATSFESALNSTIFLLNYGRTVPLDYFSWHKSLLPSYPDISSSAKLESKQSEANPWDIKDTATRLAMCIDRAYQCQLLAKCVSEGLLPSYIPPSASGPSKPSSGSSTAPNAQSKLVSSLPFPFAVLESPTSFSRRLFECWRTEVVQCLSILTKNIQEELENEDVASSSSDDSDALQEAAKSMPGLPGQSARLLRFLLSRTGLGSRSRLVSSLSHFVISWLLQFDSHIAFWKEVCQQDILRDVSTSSSSSGASSAPSGNSPQPKSQASPQIMISSESIEADSFADDERLASSTASSTTFSGHHSASARSTATSTRAARIGISAYAAQFRVLLQRPSAKFVELVNHALKSKLIHVRTFASNIVELCLHHDVYQANVPATGPSTPFASQPQPWVHLWTTRLGGVAILDALTHGIPPRLHIPGYGSMGAHSQTASSSSSSSAPQSATSGLITPRSMISPRTSSDYNAQGADSVGNRPNLPLLASVSAEVWYSIFWKVCGPPLALAEITTPAMQFIAGKTQLSTAANWLNPHPPSDQSHAILDHLTFGTEPTDGAAYLLGASTNPNQVRWTWEGAQGVPGVSPPPPLSLLTASSGALSSSSASPSSATLTVPAQSTGGSSSPSTPPSASTSPIDLSLMHPFSSLEQAMMNDASLAALRDTNLFHRTLGRLLKAEPCTHSQILASTLLLMAASLRRNALLVPKTPSSNSSPPSNPLNRSNAAVEVPKSEAAAVPLSIDHILRLLVYVTTPVASQVQAGERTATFRTRTSCIRLLQLLVTASPIMNWLTSSVNLPLIATPAFSFSPSSSHLASSAHLGVQMERSPSGSAGTSFSSPSGFVSPTTAGRRRKPFGITGSPAQISAEQLGHDPSGHSPTNTSSPDDPDTRRPLGDMISAIGTHSNPSLKISEKDVIGTTPSSLENALLPLLSANSSPPTTPRTIPSSTLPSPQHSQPASMANSMEADSVLKTQGFAGSLSNTSGPLPSRSGSNLASHGTTSASGGMEPSSLPVSSLPLHLTVESSAAIWLTLLEGLISVIRFGSDLPSAMAASECLRSVVFARPSVMDVFIKPLSSQVPAIFAPLLAKKDAKKGAPSASSIEDIILQARQSGARAHSSIASAGGSSSAGSSIPSTVTNYTTSSSWLLCAAPAPLSSTGLTWAVPTLEASLPIFLRLHASLSVGQSQSATATLFSHLVDGLNASQPLISVANCLFALNQLFSGPIPPLPLSTTTTTFGASPSAAATAAANASIQATHATKAFKALLSYFVTHHLFIKVHLVYKRLLEDEYVKSILEHQTLISAATSLAVPKPLLSSKSATSELNPVLSSNVASSSTPLEPEPDAIEKKTGSSKTPGFLSGIFGKKGPSASSSNPSITSASSSGAQSHGPTSASMPSTSSIPVTITTSKSAPGSSNPSPQYHIASSLTAPSTPVVRHRIGMEPNVVTTSNSAPISPVVILASQAAPGAHMALVQLACLYHTLSTSQACHKVMKAAKGNTEFIDGIKVLSRFHSSKLAAESTVRDLPSHGRSFSLSKPNFN